MDQSISKDGKRKVPMDSATTEAGFSGKRFKAQADSSQHPKGTEQEIPAGKKTDEEASQSHSEGIGKLPDLTLLDMDVQTKHEDTFNARVCCLKKRISHLKAEKALNSKILAEVVVKLKRSISTKAHLKSRIQSLEAGIKRTHEVILMNQDVASEQNASSSDEEDY